jgi:hypothetical protein
MAGIAYGTHPLLSRLGDVALGLEKSANVQGLPAPEVAMDAPVERKLEGPPVEAPVCPSVAACSGQYGGRAHKTCTRELMATRVCPRASAVEGESVVWSRNASPGLVDVVWRCRSRVVEALRLLGLGSSDVQPEATVVLAVEPFNQFPQSQFLHVEALSISRLSLSPSLSWSAPAARHVWPAVSPPSAMRPAIRSGCARRCTSCDQAPFCA